MPSSHILAGLVAILAFALLLTALGWWRAARRGGVRSRARNAVAQRGEATAELMLEEAGYTVLDRQVTAFWSIEVDGEEIEVSVRADLWVGKGDLRYVAEVKTGERAPDPTHPATRRQLLEYLLVFQPDGLLLVDIEAGAIREIDFPRL